MNSVYYESVKSLLTIGDTVLINRNQSLWFPNYSSIEDYENFTGMKGIIIELYNNCFSILEINITKKIDKEEGNVRCLDKVFKPFHTRVVLIEKTYKPHY